MSAQHSEGSDAAGRRRCAWSVGDGASAFVGGLGAYLVFMGADADFLHWRHRLHFFGITQEVSWTFPIAASAGLALLVGLAVFVVERLRNGSARAGLRCVESLAFSYAVIVPVSGGLFVHTRPPNFSLGMCVLACVFAFALGVIARMAGLAFDLRAGRRRWREEIAAAPFLVNGLLVAVSLVIAMLGIEAILRVHDPFLLRVKGDRIVLQTNYRFVIKNPTPGKLEPLIVNTRNSLGFRGPNPPGDVARYLSIVTVGGSTTENYYLSDDKTWTAVMERTLEPRFKSLWVNNAGLMGLSTSAHLLLLRDYLVRLRPKVIVYLIGINDLIKDGFQPFRSIILDKESAILRERNNVRSVLERLADHSEVANLVLTFVRRYEAAAAGAQPFRVKLTGEIDTLKQHKPVPGEYRRLHAILGPALSAYEVRVRRLVEETRAMGAMPVLVTQPLLFGEGRDPDRGFDLASIADEIAHTETSSLTVWRLLEDYNDVVRRVGASTTTPVIDLAGALSKRSAFFTDMMHFSIAGAARVGRIVAAGLCPALERRFPGFATDGRCAP